MKDGQPGAENGCLSFLSKLAPYVKGIDSWQISVTITECGLSRITTGRERDITK